MRAIETRYKGHRFRSRLEARWAVFFDAIGIRWEYEPEGFELKGGMRYLPDFYLPAFTGGIYAEVKPEGDAAVKAKRFALEAERRILVLGGPPALKPYILYGDHHPAEYSQVDVTFHRNYLPGGHHAHEYRLFWTPSDADLMAGMQHAIDAARSARFEFGESG